MTALPNQPRPFIPSAIFQSLSILAQLTTPFLFKLIIDEAIGGGELDLLWLYAGLSAAAFGLASLFRFLARWSSEKLAADFWLELRGRTFSHLVNLPMARHGAQQAGDLIARVQFDTYSLRNLYTGVFPSVVELLVGSAVTMVALLYLEPMMTLVALGAFPIIFLIAWVFRDKIGPLTKRVAKYQGKVYAGVTEGLNGLESLKTYDDRGQFAAQLQEDGEGLRDAQLELARFQAMLFPLLNFAIALILLGVLVAGGQMVIEGALSVGTLVAYYYYVSRSLGPIRGATGIVFGWHRAQAARARLDELFAIKDSLPAPVPPEPIPAPSAHAPTILAFEHVSFEYEPDKPVLRDVSFELPSGARLALLGASGNGKSTLGKLVARLYDPLAGQITYAGRALTQFEETAWRTTIGYVGQEVFLFHGSIADNIRFGALEEVSDADIARVARIARVDAIAQGRAGGLGAQVGEKGARLSGGQRKRIGLARALIRNPRILVIDQLAADLEADLCRAIFADLRREFPELAILHLGHRVPAGFEPDAVYWMERGVLQPYVDEERAARAQPG